MIFQHNLMWRVAVMACLLTLLVLLTACGGGDDAAPAADTPAPTEAADSGVTPPTDAQPAAADPTAPQPTEVSDASSDTSPDAPNVVVVAGEPTPTLPPGVLPTNEAGEPLVARVNGVGITQNEYDRELARSQSQSLVADPAALRFTVLDILIEQELINQAADEFGVVVTDADVQAEVDVIIDIAGSDEAWQNWLATNDYTETEFRQASRGQLVTVGVRDAVTSTQDFSRVQQVRARHILVPTDQAARDVLTRLQNGEDFATVAQQLSQDVTTRDRGGDLGFFSRDDLTTPELADVAFGLNPGEIAGPVRTALGFHVVQTMEFEERDATLEEQARASEIYFNRWLADRRAEANIERYLN